MIEQPQIGFIVNKNLVLNTVDCRQGIHLVSLASRNENTYNLYADDIPVFCSHLHLIPYFKAIGVRQHIVDHSPFLRAFRNHTSLH